MMWEGVVRGSGRGSMMSSSVFADILAAVAELPGLDLIHRVALSFGGR